MKLCRLQQLFKNLLQLTVLVENNIPERGYLIVLIGNFSLHRESGIYYAVGKIPGQEATP